MGPWSINLSGLIYQAGLHFDWGLVVFTTQYVSVELTPQLVTRADYHWYIRAKLVKWSARERN